MRTPAHPCNEVSASRLKSAFYAARGRPGRMFWHVGWALQPTATPQRLPRSAVRLRRTRRRASAPQQPAADLSGLTDDELRRRLDFVLAPTESELDALPYLGPPCAAASLLPAQCARPFELDLCGNLEQVLLGNCMCSAVAAAARELWGVFGAVLPETFC